MAASDDSKTVLSSSIFSSGNLHLITIIPPNEQKAALPVDLVCVVDTRFSLSPVHLLQKYK